MEEEFLTLHAPSFQSILWALIYDTFYIVVCEKIVPLATHIFVNFLHCYTSSCSCLQPHHYSIPNNVIAKDEEGEFKKKNQNSK